MKPKPFIDPDPLLEQALQEVCKRVQFFDQLSDEQIAKLRQLVSGIIQASAESLAYECEYTELPLDSAIMLYLETMTEWRSRLREAAHKLYHSAS